ncbi:outer membrane channel protein TolC [Succinimonas sp.]|uniref:outer membrane channel protein TolC n=1 Tax=Succinimonas sp. TaxID=1936151 RepID=UPI003865E1FD
MHLKFIAAMLFSCAASCALGDNLLDIYNLAQQKDPTVLKAKAERDSAYAAINEADAANLPQINLSGNASYTKTNNNDLNTSFTGGGSLSLQQAIWRHSNFITSSIAQKTATQMDLIYNDAKQYLIQRVAVAYFDVLNAMDSLEYAKANQKALKRQLDESNQRFKVGLIANTDVQEAQATYDQSVAEVIVAENNVANSIEELRQITGTYHKDLARLDVSRFSTPGVKSNAEFWLKTAEENNMSLQSKMVSKEIYKERISRAQTGHEPTLDLVGSLSSQYTKYKADYMSSQSGTLNSARIGVQFNMPLYSGGAVSSQVEQAKADYIAASEDLEKTHRSVQNSIYSQYNNINAAIGTVRAYQQGVISAESALKATEAGYQVGTRTITDVLDATKNLYSAKSNLANARYNYITSWVKLRYTSGLLSEEDINLINAGLMR